MIIGKNEFDRIKSAKPGERFPLIVDCGLRSVEVFRCEKSATLNNDLELSIHEKVKDKFLYLLDKQGLKKIAFFSESSNRFYKLMPTSDWPTITISSVPMHRRSSPRVDTLNKIEALGPYGYVLDTCMGPGYTAIEAAKKGRKIITFEKDEIIYEIDKLNPYSRGLFESDKIDIRLSNVIEGISGFSDSTFDCIIHDPPTFKMAPELFANKFYNQLIRVLKKGSRLFHYAPFYKIKQGYDFPKKIKNNLTIAGFKDVKFIDKAQGLICRK
jgi:uncharacterized protein